MGDVENGSVLGLPLTKKSRVRNASTVLMCDVSLATAVLQSSKRKVEILTRRCPRCPFASSHGVRKTRGTLCDVTRGHTVPLVLRHLLVSCFFFPSARMVQESDRTPTGGLNIVLRIYHHRFTCGPTFVRMWPTAPIFCPVRKPLWHKKKLKKI